MKVQNLFLFFLLLLLSSIQAEHNDYNLSEDLTQEILTTTEKIYRIPITADIQGSLIRIKLIPQDLSNPTAVYVSTDLSKLNYNNSKYKSIELRPFVYVPSSYYINKSELFVMVKCSKNCNYNIAMTSKDQYIIEDNSAIEIKFEKIGSQMFTYELKEKAKNFQIIVQSDEKGQDIQLVDSFIKEYNKYDAFNNGQGFMIYKKDYEKQGLPIFHLLLSSSFLLPVYRIIHREISDDEIKTGKTIDSIALREKVMMFLDGNKYIQNCFTILNDSSFNVINYIMNARSYTRNVLITITNPEGNSIKNQTIDHTGFFQFSSQELSNKETICIKANKDPKEIVGIEYQIFDEADLMNSQPYNSPLIRNSPIISFLPKGGIMYYRLNSIALDSFQSVIINYHMIEGESIAYVYKMHNYPNEIVKPLDISFLLKEKDISVTHDVNDNFYYLLKAFSNPYHSSEQQACLVHCPETNENGCQFYLSMSINHETIQLPLNTKIYSPLLKSSSQAYYFTISDDLVTKINVYLYAYAGDTDYHVEQGEGIFKKPIGTYHLAGNRKLITIIKSDLSSDYNSLKGLYTIKVETKGSTNAYYSIYYTIDTDSQASQPIISSGEIVFETINKNQGKKTFTFINRLHRESLDFFVNIISVNCDITVFFKEKKQTSTERKNVFMIKSSEEAYSNKAFNFDISIDGTDTKSDDPNEDCMLRLTANEISFTKEILLNEKTKHQMDLTKDNKKIMYIYPMVFPKKGDDLIINLIKMNEGNIIISYAIQSNDFKKSYEVNKDKFMVYLKGDELRPQCLYGEICSLIISVERNNLSSEEIISFSIEVLSQSSVPSYIQSGEVIQDMIKTNEQWFYKYYYTDISHEDYGEIVLNFNKGNGILFAKIVSKDNIDLEGDWNHRVELPKLNGKGNYIKYDYYNSKAIFTKEDTKKCKEAGCELYISVTSEKETNNSFYEYSLFIRKDKDNKKSIVNLIPNEFFTGSLMSINEEHVYIIHIYSDTDRILINLIGNQAYGYAKLGKESPKTIEDSNWEFKALQTHMLEIKASDFPISSTTMKDIDITFIIKTKAIDHITSSLYSLKVIIPFKNLPTIIPLTNTHSNYCDILQGKDRCYFIYPINQLGINEKLYFHAFNEESLNSHYEIYTKQISREIYENLSVDNYSSKLPSEDSNDQTSISELHTNRILIESSYLQSKEDGYLLITVKSPHEGLVSLIYNGYDTEKDILLVPNKMQLLYPSSSATLRLFSVYSSEDNKYLMEIIRFEGNSGFFPRKEVLFNHNQKNLAIAVSLKSTEQKIINKFGCLAKFTKIHGDQHINRIFYGRINPFFNYWLLLKEKIQLLFPSSFYVPIMNYNENVSITIRLITLMYNKKKTISDLFDINGFVTDESFIIKRNDDYTAQPPEDSNIITFDYNEMLRLGHFTFTIEEIHKYKSSEPKYLFFTINQGNDNKNEYSLVQTQVTAMVQNAVKGEMILPSNQYYFGKATHDQITVLHLFKNTLGDKIIEIEYSSGNLNNTFTINPIPEDGIIDYTKSSIEYKVDKVNGKQLILLDVTDTYKNGIAFAIMKASAPNENFAIRYFSESYYLSHFSIHNNTCESSINSNDKTMVLSFDNVLDQYGRPTEIDYVLNYYKSEKENEGRSVFMNSKPLKTERFKGSSLEKRITYVAKDIPSEEFYIGLIAIGKIGINEHILLYDHINIENTVPPKVNLMLYLIIGGGIILIIVIAILIVCLKKYCEKNCMSKKDDKQNTSDYGQISNINPILTEED